MKRILTLLLTAGVFTAANAQFPKDDDRRVVIENGNRYPGNGRDVIIGNGPNVGAYPSNRSYGYDRRFEVDRLNRDYDVRIQAVWNDRYLHRGEKKRIVRDLDRERQLKIDEINRRCDAWERDRRDNNWRNGRY